MAREPQVIPFAEGMPSDDFQIEEIGNDEVLVGDPSLDIIEEQDSSFDQNLAETIDAKELNAVASQLISSYEADKEARSQWEDRYKQGLETLDVHGGQEEEEDQKLQLFRERQMKRERKNRKRSQKKMIEKACLSLSLDT